MKSHPQYDVLSGSLARNHWNVPIRVRLAPYVEFSRWLDAELEKLVRQWSDKAAPNASRLRQPAGNSLPGFGMDHEAPFRERR